VFVSANSLGWTLGASPRRVWSSGDEGLNSEVMNIKQNIKASFEQCFKL